MITTIEIVSLCQCLQHKTSWNREFMIKVGFVNIFYTFLRQQLVLEVQCSQSKYPRAVTSE